MTVVCLARLFDRHCFPHICRVPTSPAPALTEVSILSGKIYRLLACSLVHDLRIVLQYMHIKHYLIFFAKQDTKLEALVIIAVVKDTLPISFATAALSPLFTGVRLNAFCTYSRRQKGTRGFFLLPLL